MSFAEDARKTGSPILPRLGSLLSGYLQKQAEAHANGLAAVGPDGEVLPYDVGPVQPIDAKPAWEEAVAAAKFYGAVETRSLQAPPQWPHLVASHEPETALAFCLGNFPQLVRNFHTLVGTSNLRELRPNQGRPVQAAVLVDWAKQTSSQFSRVLLALGALRLAKQFEAADEIVQANDATVPAEWRAAWANERASLQWHRGRHDEAMAQWQAAKDSVPVLFNRGMAALFCGQRDEAKAPLTQAVSQLAESSAWYHLGQLYLTLTMPS